MKFKLSLLALAFLTACGGGGGSSTPSTPVTPVTPAPTVQITLSTPKIFIGDTAKISWTSSNATTCTGVDGFAGIQPINGTINFTPTVGGQFKYSLRCTGAGGSSDAIQTVIVPIPPQRTSYLNRQNINMAPQKMPVSSTYVQHEAITAGHAYGDFFQDGTIAMVAATNVFSGKANVASLVPGRIYFFHSDGKGGWLDQTDKILSANDRAGCISPRKVLVADFNGDKKPDVFVACHGVDADPQTGYYGPIGEKPRFIMSQIDGSYKNQELDLVCYCHGAAAVDFSGDGFSDVVLTSPPVLNGVVYMKNLRDGKFVQAQELIPSNTYRKMIWNAEFVDVNEDNKFDLMLSGSSVVVHPESAYNARIILNDGTNIFRNDSESVFTPADEQGETGFADIIVKDKKIALLRFFKASPSDALADMRIQILSYPSMSTTYLQKVGVDKDTVWFTLYNGNIMNAFSHNPYSVKF